VLRRRAWSDVTTSRASMINDSHCHAAFVVKRANREGEGEKTKFAPSPFLLFVSFANKQPDSGCRSSEE
jgi:hypothetical protein